MSGTLNNILLNKLFIGMKDMKNIAKLVQEMEQDMCNCYHTGEILHLLKVDPDFVLAAIGAVMSDREHFRALGLIVGEA
jgi:hypothetical protein